jgi:hypothetical protein
MNVKQFKLVTGEEILADMVSSDLDEYGDEVLFLRNVYLLVSTENFEEGIRFYTFRPFMMHQYEDNKILALNAGSVICSALPDRKVVDQYESHCATFSEDKTEEPEDNPEEPNVVKFKPKLH